MRKIITVFLCFFMVSVFAQDTIYWNKQRPLAWEDFQAQPMVHEPEAAQATTGVGLAFRFRENIEAATWEYQFDVFSYFLPDLSWYKKEYSNYYLLEHEQTHFNISELFARKLKKELSELTPSESVGEEAERIYHKMQKEHAKFQNKYDRETKHSLHIEEELLWQKKVKDALLNYYDWR